MNYKVKEKILSTLTEIQFYIDMANKFPESDAIEMALEKIIKVKGIIRKEEPSLL